MAVPWLRVLDALIGVTDLARSRRRRSGGSEGGLPPPEELEALPPGSRMLGQLETRLTGVVVAALKEAFDRDSRRLELEREQLEAERARAERALQLELARQAGDREVGRLRLVAGVAVGSWIGTLFLAARIAGASFGARVALGGGWVLLLAALACAFVGQARVGDALARAAATEAEPGPRPSPDAWRDVASSGTAGAFALWLVIIGLALVGLAVLIG